MNFYPIALVLQQGLQLLAQHQGAEVRNGYRLRVRHFSPHAVLTNTNTLIILTAAALILGYFAMVRSTDRRRLQAAGQAGGGDAVSGSLGVVQALQRTPDTVAARQ